LKIQLHLQPASMDTLSIADLQGSSPQNQVQLRSHVDLSHGFLWDVNANFIGALPAQGVSSYTRIDTQLRWKFAEAGEFSLVGQNLLRGTHVESMDSVTLVNSSLIKRSAYAKFTYRLR